MIFIANLRTFKPAQHPNVEPIYIGRQMGSRPASPLANRFRLPSDTPAGRRACLLQYWTDLDAQPRSSPAWQDIARLALLATRKDLALCCWCHPAGCHGDVIKWRIEVLNHTSSFWRAWNAADEAGRYALDERAAILEYNARLLPWDAERAVIEQAGEDQK